MNYGTFSLAVLASAIRDIVAVTIVDATNLSLDKAAKTVIAGDPEVVGITVMGVDPVKPVCARDR